MASLTRGRMGYLLTNFTKVLTNSRPSFYKTQQSLFHCGSFLYAPGQEINMPSLSPTMEEGKIIKWLKKEGDVINPGDVLCEIETDKAIVSMEIEEEGILAKILVPENSSKIKVGSLIALMVGEGEDWKNVDVPAGVGAGVKSESSSSSSSSSFSSDSESDDKKGSSGPTTYAIKMPSLSPTMSSGTLVKWLKNEGDTVAAGDTLCDIQTDKAIMSLEAEEDGILAKILVPNDTQDVKVGTLIALVVPEGEDWKKVVVPTASAQTTDDSGIKEAPKSGSQGDAKGKTFGPAVKGLLTVFQLDPAVINHTGRNNRILKEDVLKYIEDNKLQKKTTKHASAPVAQPKAVAASKPKSVPKKAPAITPSKYTDVGVTPAQQMRAKRIVQSKQEIPHSYSVAKCDVSKLLEAKDALSSEGMNLSLDDFLTKAAALALQLYPRSNAVCVNDEVRYLRDIDICVVIPTSQGLLNPVIKSANLKSVTAISQEIKIATEEGKGKPEEMQGGSFTISNLGMLGLTEYKSVINPPQCAALAVGAIVESLNSDLVIQKHVKLSLSYDRRAMQELEAVEFMETLKYVIENPKLILLNVTRNSMEMKI